MKEFIDITKLGVLILQTYNKASDNEEILKSLNEIKNKSQRLYALETKKLLSLIPQSCSWLYDMYALPEPLNNEAVRNLYNSSTKLMGYDIYEQDLPDNIWRFCVCFGSWLKHVVFCYNNVPEREKNVLIKHSLKTSMLHTRNLFSNQLTMEETLEIDKILNRKIHSKYAFDIQTILLKEDELEITKRITNRLSI